MKKSTNLAPSRVFLICKDAGKSSAENIHEMIFYLKKNYSAHNREQARVDDIPQDGWSISFEEMSNHLKTYSKSVTEGENTTSKTKVLLRGWLSTPFKVYRRDKTRGKTLPSRFGDWIQRECGIAKQTIHNYKNLYKLMSIAPKLFNCRVNTTYFIKNHNILINHFRDIKNTPWSHTSDCVCQNCSSYFTDTEHTLTS